MKHILSCLLILSFVSFQSCQIEHVDKDKIEMAKKRQAEKQKQRKAEQKKKKEQKKAGLMPESDDYVQDVLEERLSTPAFENLTASRKQTLAAINQVNGEYVMMKDEAIKITDNFIKIKGTAIDRPLAKSPAGAYIKIGAKSYPVDNWLPRKKYADKAKNPDYLMSAFEVEIPVEGIKPGTKIMTLFVVSADRENYYTATEKVKIII